MKITKKDLLKFKDIHRLLGYSFMGAVHQVEGKNDPDIEAKLNQIQLTLNKFQGFIHVAIDKPKFLVEVNKAVTSLLEEEAKEKKVDTEINKAAMHVERNTEKESKSADEVIKEVIDEKENSE